MQQNLASKHQPRKISSGADVFWFPIAGRATAERSLGIILAAHPSHITFLFSCSQEKELHMPTAREFENAAIEYCLDRSSIGVWAMRLEQIDHTAYDITVRMGGHYRADTGGVATIRVTYHPIQQRYTC